MVYGFTDFLHPYLYDYNAPADAINQSIPYYFFVPSKTTQSPEEKDQRFPAGTAGKQIPAFGRRAGILE
jgi:hypothetical protein